MPAAEILRCPSCGAAASTDSAKCQFCGARLATAACPSCFGMMFVGEKFCPHCGAAAQRTELPATGKLLCCNCQAEMKQVQVGKAQLWECSSCEGIWLDASTLQQICEEKDQQSDVLGMPSVATTPAKFESEFRYRPCPVCHALMNRINFAHCSGIIVVVCKPHGTFFDRDELRRIIEFIRSGGLQKARTREIANLKAERERLANAPTAAIPLALSMPVDDTITTSVLTEIGKSLLSLLE